MNKPGILFDDPETVDDEEHDDLSWMDDEEDNFWEEEEFDEVDDGESLFNEEMSQLGDDF